MYQTKHIQQRMSQRGITKDLVNYVLCNGVLKQDKHVIGKKEALKQLEELEVQRKILTKIIDKGGVVVVADGNAMITAYNFNH